MSTSRHSTDQEEAVLQSLFSLFSYFGYDKAKEIAEKERDLSKSSGSATWNSILMCVAQLAAAEKLYMNLAFLTTKGFLRKECSLKSTYEALLVDLSELGKRQETFVIANRVISDGVLLHLCSHLVLFIQARIQLIVFYEKLLNFSSSQLMNFEELYHFINEIVVKNSRNFHHPLFAPVKTGFTYECEILLHLIRSHLEMQRCSFLPSLLNLNDAHSKLNSWQATLQIKESKKSMFSSNFLKSAPSLPSLYQWLGQLLNVFLAKFSLYFHDTLSSQTTPTEMKNLLSRQAGDYVTKIQNFQRKSNATSVCLVYEGTDARSLGYKHPDNVSAPPKGLGSYPAIFCCPAPKPETHWPSVIMMISDRNADLNITDRVIYFHDQKKDFTYFLCRIEPHVTIVIIFEFKKPENDVFIQEFVTDFAVQLRCNKIFAQLKPK